MTSSSNIDKSSTPGKCSILYVCYNNRLCFLIVFVVSVGVAALPFISDEYGPAGVYCGFKDTPDGDYWRLAT